MTSKKTVPEAASEAAASETAAPARDSAVGEAVASPAKAAPKAAEAGVAMTKVQFEKSQKAAAKGYEDLVGLQKQNFEAAVEAGNIVASGYEAIGKEVMAFTQTAFEANFAAVQAILGAKTLREAAELQREHLRKSLNQTVAESGKLGEMSVKLASEAIEPLQARVNAAVERFLKPMAA